MAKKWKKKIEEEPGEFKFPKFDEREFIEKELKETKILLVTVLFGIIFAVISLETMVYVSKDFFLGLVIGVIGIISLRGIYPAFKIDISVFEPKKWFMSGASFFGVWLSVWVILCNPPISDFTAPSIDNVRIGNSTTDINNGVTFSYVLGSWTNISITAKISDNYQLNTGQVKLSFVPLQGSSTPTPKSINRTSSGSAYRWDISKVYVAQYTVTISAVDNAGNQRTVSFMLDFNSQ